MGAKSVVVKRGEYGALLVSGQESFYAPAYPLAEVVDPTGAGDSFAGGFLGLLDRLDSAGVPALRQAVVMGCTIASFTVEAFSLDRLRTLDLVQVRGRFNAFRALVHFDELPELAG
jgi:sugar/nucleoside kinase (ribokinase family)